MINSNLQSAIVKIFTNSFFSVTSGICCCKVCCCKALLCFYLKGSKIFPIRIILYLSLLEIDSFISILNY